jgi:enediyne biosynthesis protein E4
MNRRSICWIFFLGLGLIFYSCIKQKDELFTQVSHNRTGITFRNTIEETEDFNHLHYSYLYNGAGVGIGDFNNDGLADIFFAGNLVSSRLYLNKGDLRFEDITKSAGVSAGETWNNGVNLADINGDGFLDIYLCSSTDGRPEYRRNLLFINNGDLTFSEKAREYGIDDPAYSTHSAFFDYDKDGDLDLFSLNHSVDSYAMFNERSPGYKNEPSEKYGHKLFKNEGSYFREVTREAGIISNVINFGLGIAVADFNNDNWPDIYICNDYYEQDYLFINQKDGTFSEQLQDFFSHVSFSSMGCDAADINNDGYIDLFTLDMLPEDNREQKLVEGPHNYEKFKLLEKRGFYHQTTRNMLQMNNHGEYFTEIGQFAGIYRTNWSWSPLLCDFDNDGLKDLFISNGYGKNNTHMDVIMLLVEDVLEQRKGGQGLTNIEIVDQVPPTILKNYMFRNNGDLTFSDVGKQWGFDKETLSNGAAYADLDNDGDMDLVISNINDYAAIYRNNAEKITNNHYLKIRLEGSGKNSRGIGARINLIAGDRTFVQEYMPSRGYMSSMDQPIVFGLGEITRIDTLRVIWPDLRVQEITGIDTDQEIILKNENARPEQTRHRTIPDPVFRQLSADSIADLVHRENDFIDFRDQPLLPYLLSTQGPRLATGDVDNDGDEDIYIGGAMGHRGKIFIQEKDSRFVEKEIPGFGQDASCEDQGALFFDADNDGDLDLYVVSGGNEFSVTSSHLQDRLYLNDGSGSFSKARDHLPKMLTSGSCIRMADINNDGYPDLFIGGRLTPGLYPIAPRSYILENDGKGHFVDVTRDWNEALVNPGMVTDAIWTDFNGDGLTDLILVGEWMPVRIFRNTGASLQEIKGQPWMENSTGWWNRIVSGDFDGDGDPDYVLGNFGLNSELKASSKEPVSIYAGDFDNNGSLDAVTGFYNRGKLYPIYSKDDLAEQISFINEKYPDYRSYADQTMADIFPGKCWRKQWY